MPGATLGAVDCALAEQSRQVPLGCNTEVGVAERALAPWRAFAEPLVDGLRTTPYLGVMSPTNEVGDLFRPNPDAPREARDDSAVAAMRQHETTAYITYLSDDGPESVRRSYGTSFARLQVIKRCYDPDNVFHRNRDIIV